MKFGVSYSKKTGVEKATKDIFHSIDYCKMNAAERNRLAFKTDAELKKMGVSKDDRLRLAGVRQSNGERSKAFRYRHSEYVSKSKN